MYTFSKAQKHILKSAYDNYKSTGTRYYRLVIKNSNDFCLVDSLRSLAKAGYIEAISDNFYNNCVSIPPVYEFNLTYEGEFAAESL